MAKILTQIGIDKFQPTDKRREVPDGALSGLYVVVQPSSVKSFALRYRYNGKPRKLTLGRYPQLSLQGAREKAREALERLSYGDDPGKQKDNPARFEAAFEVFMERHVAQTRGTYETRRIYNHDLLPNFQKKLLSQVSRKDVINLLDEIVDRGAPIMANRVLAVLRKFYSWAIARDLTTNNPCEGLKPPSKQKSRDRILNEEELNIFWRACGAMGYPYGTYFQFLLLSAQRCSEVAEMTFEEIQGSDWVIPALRAKNGIKHTVPMTDKMLSLLGSKGRNTGFVFTAAGDRPINNLGRAAKRLRTLMQTLAQDLGIAAIEEWRPHDLRRTAASGMARCGIYQEVIERVQNRISGKFAGVAGIYNRYDYKKEKREALSKWSSDVHRVTIDG